MPKSPKCGVWRTSHDVSHDVEGEDLSFLNVRLASFASVSRPDDLKATLQGSILYLCHPKELSTSPSPLFPLPPNHADGRMSPNKKGKKKEGFEGSLGLPDSSKVRERACPFPSRPRGGG